MLLPLRVMVIEDMIYIVHTKGLAEYVSTSLSLQPQLMFVDLEQDPPLVCICFLQAFGTYHYPNFLCVLLFKSYLNIFLNFLYFLFFSLLFYFSVMQMLSQTDQNLVVSELVAIQKLFSSLFSVDGITEQPSECKVDDSCASTVPQVSNIIDLSRIVKDVQITLPTLNG